mmetsp:Transcript_5029/g.13831  ORF Transcript_5029/g.13831 Transcript_5029/m.13831 type:complete len:239 (+) Transcript_5029:28-744(+)
MQRARLPKIGFCTAETRGVVSADTAEAAVNALLLTHADTLAALAPVRVPASQVAATSAVGAPFAGDRPDAAAKAEIARLRKLLGKAVAEQGRQVKRHLNVLQDTRMTNAYPTSKDLQVRDHLWDSRPSSSLGGAPVIFSIAGDDNEDEAAVQQPQGADDAPAGIAPSPADGVDAGLHGSGPCSIADVALKGTAAMGEDSTDADAPEAPALRGNDGPGEAEDGLTPTRGGQGAMPPSHI